MDVRSHRDRGSRDTTPDRAKMCRLQPKNAIHPPNPKRVHLLYYLSRNGLLEHPHFLEITLLPNQPLRLKDVFARLIALRGSGMPLQYSWSCKRNYKSGYVWCDLGVNDIIHPAEGAEYVLKGSELIEACSERFQQLQLGATKHPHPKRKSFNSTPHANREFEDQYQEYEEEEEEGEEEERTSFTYTTSSAATPHSSCSKGVSTDELLEGEPQFPAKGSKVITPTQQHATSATLAQKLGRDARVSKNGYEDAAESVPESTPGRNSVLLQLIACGTSGADFKGARNEARRVRDARERGACVEGGRRRVENNAACSSSEAEMIKYVSEKPRFGGLVSEEKEYFSGSLVDSIHASRAGQMVEPVLKRSNSYNQERSSKLGIEEEKLKGMEDEEKREGKVGVKGKCIPRKKSSKESKK